MNLTPFCAFCAACLAALLAAPLHAHDAAAKPPVEAAAAADPADRAPALAGHYYLQGVMETGSELMLRPDGTFLWYFTYGALDLDAIGKWTRDGDRVVLRPEEFNAPPQFPEARFERMELRIDGEALVPAWPWEGGEERGRYEKAGASDDAGEK